MKFHPEILLSTLPMFLTSSEALLRLVQNPSRLPRRSLFTTSFVVIASTGLFPSPSFAATNSNLVEQLSSTQNQYKVILDDIPSFINKLSANDSTTSLPQQIPILSFQKLAPSAHDARLGSTGAISKDDFQFVAMDYAEHAGAARDLCKLSKMGWSGENGGADVARSYAERCADELKLASALLEGLLAAVE